MQGIRTSFTSCPTADMDRLFWFSLLLTYLPVTKSNGKDNCFTQTANWIEQKTGQSAVLNCNVRDNCTENAMNLKWFVFTENNHHCLNLDKDKHKFRLTGVSLQIISLNVSDSGIYHCAVELPGEPTQGRQYVGPGTTLIVRGPVTAKVKYILLRLSFVLLAIYSFIILSLIIIKKCGCSLSICERTYKSDKNNSTKNETRRTKFHDVLEEMYSQKNLARQKKTAGRNEAEAASTNFNGSNDDIYQNV